MKTRLLAGGLLAALVLTGCGDASAVRGDTAAKVGDTRITTERLSKIIDQVRTLPTAQAARSDLAGFQRGILGLLVNVAAADAVTTAKGISVTPADIEKAREGIAAQSGGTVEDLPANAAKEGLTPDLLEQLLRLNAQQQALADQLIASTFIDATQLQQTYEAAKSSFQQVSFSQIVLPSAAAARALLPQAKALDAAGFERLASQRTTQSQGKANGGVLEHLTLSSFTSAGQEAYGRAVLAAKVGATIVVPVGTGANVVRVLSNTIPTLEQITPQLRRQLLGDKAQEVVVAELTAVPVRLNPRFGTWDAKTATVVGPDQQPGRKLSIPAPTAAPTTAPALGGS